MDERNWPNCAVSFCVNKACIRLHSAFCFVHALERSPALMVQELVACNERYENLQDEVDKLKKGKTKRLKSRKDSKR